jgi:HK97 family phage prohead protease
MRRNSRKDIKEIRLRLAPQKFEIRKNADGSRSISGYAATFGDLSQDLGGFREKIQRGAFAQSLKDNPDVLCLYGHDDNQILGRVSSGTLTIAEDAKGLKFTCKLPDTTTARDLIALMERGDISQMSFGFMVNQNGDSWDEVSGQLIRTLISVTLFEISVVGMPAYTSTSVSLRNAPAAIRAKLKLKSKRDEDDEDEDDPANPDPDYDDEDDEDDEGDDCRCDCRGCRDGYCALCSDESCDGDSDNCRDCGMQLTRAHLKLLALRAR